MAVAAAGLCWSVVSMAAWTPIIHNHPSKSYGAGTQNWAIAEHQNGWMYVANNYGLLEYDGSHWALYGINNSTALRSITIGEKGDIYVGGTDEFGVFSANEMGSLQYTNLSPYIPERYQHFGEVWQLQVANGLLYVQTRHYIFICGEKGEIEVLDPGAIIYKSIFWEGNLYVATGRDLYVQSGNRLHALRGAEILHGKVVCSLVPYKNQGLLIGTEFHGLYLYDGKSVRPFQTDADMYIKEHQLYTIAINEKYIALGTVQGGVVLTNLEGENTIYITRDNGLQNNTILSLSFDQQNKLWMGLDNGIDVIGTGTMIYRHNDKHVNYGSGYASLVHKGKLYLGSNQGLYALSDRNASPLLVEGSQGQVWNIREVAGELLCCHHRGLFVVRDGKMEALDCNDGVWDIQELNDSIAIVGSYAGFYCLHLKKKPWRLEPLRGHAETALHYALDQKGHIWSLSSEGVYRHTIDWTRNTLESECIIQQTAAARYYSIAHYGTQTLITSEDYCGVITEDGKLVADNEIAKKLAGVHRYREIEMDADSNLWYIHDNTICVRQYNSSRQSYGEEEVIVSANSFFIDGFYSISRCGDNGMIVGSVDGFYLMRPTARVSSPKENIYVRKISLLADPSVSLYGESYDGEKETEVRIPPHERALRIELSGNNTIARHTQFRTRLHPLEENFTSWQQMAYRDLSNLPTGGKYRLDIEMQSTHEGNIVSRSLPIYLEYPWYLTWWAKGIYALLLISILNYIGWRIYRSVQKSKRRLTEQKNEEIYQQKLRILQLENEQAQQDLRNKSQELSNILLSEANRKEWNEQVLMEIRRIVECINEDKIAEAKGKIQHLQHRLARNGEKNINWKRFEENFDIVNNQLITRLMSLYPWMSKQERRLCVYIHMGLTTKEMAPLMNVSVRGIEMMRYRLRSKMQIDSNISLKQYFSEIQQAK